jgi:signal transduction histidine kinase
MRLPERVEVAAYYMVAEALTNAPKHAHASVVHLNAEAVGHALRLRASVTTASAGPIRSGALAS